MLTRNKILVELKCKACNQDLNDFELNLYHEFDCLCEQCYSISMEAAYEDEDYLTKFFGE